MIRKDDKSECCWTVNYKNAITPQRRLISSESLSRGVMLNASVDKNWPNGSWDNTEYAENKKKKFYPGFNGMISTV